MIKIHETPAEFRLGGKRNQIPWAMTVLKL
jgi:hypothetical protein